MSRYRDTPVPGACTAKVISPGSASQPLLHPGCFTLPIRLRPWYAPVVIDLNDMRLVSDEQTTTNVEAFIEQLEERK